MRSSGLQGCPGNASSQDKNAENLPKWYASVEVGALAMVSDTCLVTHHSRSFSAPFLSIGHSGIYKAHLDNYLYRSKCLHILQYPFLSTHEEKEYRM